MVLFEFYTISSILNKDKAKSYFLLLFIHSKFLVSFLNYFKNDGAAIKLILHLLLNYFDSKNYFLDLECLEQNNSNDVIFLKVSFLKILQNKVILSLFLYSNYQAKSIS